MDNIKIYKDGDSNQRMQGDISIIKVEKFEGEFKPLPQEGYIVGHSESGHNHVVVAERGSQIEFATDERGTYIKVKEGTGTVVHEKVGGHAPQTIEVGIHYFGKQFEYDEIKDRQVLD
jgi:hypothetical protein